MFRNDLSNGGTDVIKESDAEEDKDTSLEDSLTDKIERQKKSVKFADGVKPGEGTSPEQGDGDMPSPPPLLSAKSSKDPRGYAKRLRKKAKRTKLPREKKKVKVIIYATVKI